MVLEAFWLCSKFISLFLSFLWLSPREKLSTILFMIIHDLWCLKD